MRIPAVAARRLAGDHVAWLTTVTDSGAPAPNPVWFVPDDQTVLVFTAPARKVHNIEQRPLVSLHFNSDAAGGDVVVLNGRAELDHKNPPSALGSFVAKYGNAITDELGTTIEEIDATYNTRIRIHPTKVRLTPA
ncbi:MAG: pyridoxamine 5'-phosphate oxidase family protein [Acidimicrobiia bacterium]